jgi:hypothetical protein
MNVPFGWIAPAAAIALTGLALATGDTPTVALPAAVGAVAAGAATVGEALARSGPFARRAPSPVPLNPKASIRSAFRSARFGREEIVLLLDRVERMGPGPGLPGRSIEELEQIVRMPVGQFRGYVDRRLTDLERDG